VIVVDAVMLESATAVAVMVTLAGLGTVAGAIYKPVFASIMPPPETVQVTP